MSLGIIDPAVRVVLRKEKKKQKILFHIAKL